MTYALTALLVVSLVLAVVAAVAAHVEHQLRGLHIPLTNDF